MLMFVLHRIFLNLSLYFYEKFLLGVLIFQIFRTLFYWSSPLCIAVVFRLRARVLYFSQRSRAADCIEFIDLKWWFPL